MPKYAALIYGNADDETREPPPEVMQKMTDPFFTTKDVGEGTGLGLWITENIVRAHGGTLSCESTPGEGATFTVVLPQRAPETARQGILVTSQRHGKKGAQSQ